MATDREATLAAGRIFSDGLVGAGALIPCGCVTATAHLYLFSDASPGDWLVDGRDEVWHTIVNVVFQSDPGSPDAADPSADLVAKHMAIRRQWFSIGIVSPHLEHFA